jgi:hypothetical protein
MPKEVEVIQSKIVGDITEEFDGEKKIKVLVEEIIYPKTCKPVFLIHRYGVPNLITT